MIKFTKLPVFAIPAKYKFHYLDGRVGLGHIGKPFTLMKNILKKFQVTKDNSQEVERFIFLLTIEEILEKMKDPTFFKRYFWEFKNLEYLIDMYLKGSISRPDLVNWDRFDPLLPSEEASYGYLNQIVNNLDKLLTKVSLPRSVRTKSVKTRYIGVGYKDKGNLRISSFDGSPSWQEVSMQSSKANWYHDVHLLRYRYTVELGASGDSRCNGLARFE